MLLSFFGPIIILIIVSLFGFYWTGRAGGTLIEILSNTDPAKALLWGAFAMTLIGAVIALGNKLMTISEVMETIIDGMKLMLLACAILVLAWSLGEVTADMKLADYLISVVGETLPFSFVPIIIFAVSMVIAFSTGTSWGAMTIITPIAIPLTYKLTGDAYLSVIMAGIVFSGAIFGDHCSPISDTTVLSSIFSGADHMDHVSTQIPYALLAASIAGVMYLAFGFFNIQPVVLIPAGLAMLLVLAFIISNYQRKKLGIERKY
jgi:Na+/H+ antiporter NhaC